MIHKYWARKPANIVAEYIKKYSNEGDTVFDPFFGSGVVLFESALLNRNVIGTDLNPFCSFLVRTMFSQWSEVEITKAVDQIKRNISQLLEEMYSIRCPKCSGLAAITHVIYSEKEGDNEENKSPKHEQKISATNNHGTITDIYLNCFDCGNQKIKTATIINKETQRVNQIESKYQSYVQKYGSKFPDFEFKYNDGERFIQLRHDLINSPDFSLLFTKRALLVLGAIYKEICEISCESHVRDHLKLIFSASIAQASKMVWVIKNRKNRKVKNKETGSWTHHFFWNPSEYFEVNAWECMKNRVQKLISGKKDFVSRVINAKFPKEYKDFNRFSLDLHIFFNYDSFKKMPSQNSRYVGILNESATNNTIPSDSIDFIFTDPPYADSIQYMELSSIWNVWLELETIDSYMEKAQKHEITMNKRQGKGLEEYSDMMTAAFSECYRVLKDGKYMVVTFHNTELKIRNALILSATNAGFSLEQITYQMPPRVSVKSMLHHSGSPVGDLFIRFKKDNSKLNRIKQTEKQKQAKISDKEMTRIIEGLIVKILQERAEPTYWIWISTFLDQEIFKLELYPINNLDDIIDSIIKNQRFLIDKENKWWFSDPGSEKITNEPLSVRCEKEIVRLVKSNIRKQNGKQKTEKQFIYNELYKIFGGNLTPDKLTVSKLIEKHIKLSKGC
jgi:16S rRNA G966 N2-methylase RsmD/uncharacterized protein YqkB